jgi:hypothetical protein
VAVTVCVRAESLLYRGNACGTLTGLEGVSKLFGVYQVGATYTR